MRFVLLLLITPAASVGTYYLPPGLSQMEADYFLNALIEDDYLHQQPSVNFMQPPNMNEGGGGGGTYSKSFFIVDKRLNQAQGGHDFYQYSLRSC